MQACMSGIAFAAIVQVFCAGVMLAHIAPQSFFSAGPRMSAGFSEAIFSTTAVQSGAAADEADEAVVPVSAAFSLPQPESRAASERAAEAARRDEIFMGCGP
jgi:hypothetical protein